MVLVNVPGDGNCFFHCLSLAIHGNNNYDALLRRVITRKVFDNWATNKNMAELCHDQIFASPYHYWDFMTNQIHGLLHMKLMQRVQFFI